MKLAIISDIHANLEAMESVLDRLAQLSISQIYCLGDVVGYGPHPNECVALVQKRCRFSLMGNHDHAAIGKEDLTFFNRYAREAIVWTMTQLTPESKAFLESQPFFVEEGDHLFVHSTPVHPEEWNYVLSEKEAIYYLHQVKHRLVFVGHSHIPVVFPLQGRAFYSEEPISLDVEDNRYIINVGSVGQPRDGDPRACCAVLDFSNYTLQYIRVEYDVDKVMEQIQAAGLPPFLGLRLKSGH